ncbi:MAG: S8 family serine peptidase [Chloroflexi bacterium]|nr:S8 family serine peptidase [Chloroflexota bacterium]
MRLFITIAGVLMVALALSGVTAAAGPPTDRGPATHIVVFNDGVDADAASQDLAQAHGLVREFVYSQALNGASFIVPPGRVAAIESDPRVAFIERNQIVKAFAQELPTGVDRIDAALSSTANIDGADDRVDVDIAIIDTGIDLDHPDLNVVASINCARGGPFGGGCKGGGDDGNGHGTHVAGTAAALDNGIGVVGVAPGARLWAVRVLDNSGSGWMSWIVGGIDWVTANADQIDVANMSLGCACDSAALDAAIAGSVAAGVVYTVAAGNSGSDAAGYSPANHPDVITVSAIADFDGQGGALAATTCRSDAGSDDTFATFSNDGSLIEIAAPGVCILSTWNDGGYNTISGTSMASPHAAGAAALYIAASGTVADGAGAAAVRDALIAAGTPQGDADGFTGDTDGHAEPLLNVGDTAAEPDTAGPVISNVAAGNITDTSADITWGTDEASDSVVNYGTTTDLGSNASVGGLVTSHLVGLSGLTAETTYYYEVQSTDSSGNSATDDNGGSYYTFTTAAADTTGPVISNVAAGNITDTSADITWDTDEASDSVVNYGTTTALGSNASVTGLVTSHLVGLSGLTTGTTYYYEVQSTDSSGNPSTDDNGESYYTFVTAAAPAEASTVSVGSITYATSGGKNRDKHLLITVALVDDLGNPASNASVTIDLFRDGSFVASGTGTTGEAGTLTFTLNNAASGCYETTVTDVSAGTLTWDGATPANGLCK